MRRVIELPQGPSWRSVLYHEMGLDSELQVLVDTDRRAAFEETVDAWGWEVESVTYNEGWKAASYCIKKAEIDAAKE